MLLINLFYDFAKLQLFCDKHNYGIIFYVITASQSSLYPPQVLVQLHRVQVGHVRDVVQDDLDF